MAEAALELQMINENIQHTCFLSKLMKTIAINLIVYCTFDHDLVKGILGHAKFNKRALGRSPENDCVKGDRKA